MAEYTETNLNQLIINTLTQEQFDSISEKNEDELYFISDAEIETIQVQIMPDAVASEAGRIVQYIGETNLLYINGYFYQCRQVESTDTYKWYNIQVQNKTPSYMEDLLYVGVVDNPTVFKIEEASLGLTVPNKIVSGVLYTLNDHKVEELVPNTEAEFGSELMQSSEENKILFFSPDTNQYYWVLEKNVFIDTVQPNVPNGEHAIWIKTQYGGTYLARVYYSNDNFSTSYVASAPLIKVTFANGNRQYTYYNKACGCYRNICWSKGATFQTPHGFTDNSKFKYTTQEFNGVFVYDSNNWNNLQDAYMVKVPWGTTICSEYLVDSDNHLCLRDAYGSISTDLQGVFFPVFKIKDGQFVSEVKDIYAFNEINYQIHELELNSATKKEVEVINSKLEAGIVSNPSFWNYEINGNTFTLKAGSIITIPDNDSYYTYELGEDKSVTIDTVGEKYYIVDTDNEDGFYNFTPIVDNPSGYILDDTTFRSYNSTDTTAPCLVYSDAHTSQLYYVPSFAQEGMSLLRKNTNSIGDEYYSLVGIITQYDANTNRINEYIDINGALISCDLSYVEEIQIPGTTYPDNWKPKASRVPFYNTFETPIKRDRYQSLCKTGMAAGGVHPFLHWNGTEFVVYNCINYLGGTIYVMPGLRCMMYNGFDQNGFNKLVDYTVDNIYMCFVEAEQNGEYTLVLTNNGDVILTQNIYVDIPNNTLYVDNQKTIGCILANVTVKDGLIEKFDVRTPTRFAVIENLSPVAYSGQYADLLNKPNVLINNANGKNYLAVGNNARTSEDEYGSSVAIGANASTVNNSVAVGGYAETNVSGGLAIGNNAKVNNFDATTNEDQKGVAVGADANSTNAQAIAIGGDAQSSGVKSIAIGSSAVAGADGAIQLGEGTNSTANTLQFKDKTIIKGDGTVPYERLLTATPTAGQVLKYDGDSDSLAWGNSLVNNATDASSVHIGTDKNTTDGYGNVVIGPQAKAQGLQIYRNVVLGAGAIGWGDNSVAIGTEAEASKNSFMGGNAVSIGAYTKAGGANAVAIGSSAKADADDSIAIGSTNTQATGKNTIVVGKGAIAKGENAVVIGHNALSNSSEGPNVVIGPDSQVGGFSFNSTAIGIGTQAGNYDATAIGRNSYAGAQYSTAIGHSAITNTDYVDDSDTTDFPATLALGMNAHSRSNSTIAIGKAVYADGPFSTVVGYKSTVEEGCVKGISIGSESQVVGSEGIAVGNTAKSARHGISLGTRAKVNDFGGVAIGLNTDSSATNAVAIGNQSYARGGNSVALGASAIVDYGVNEAVQLGTGTNSDAYTLQFRDYKLLYENGTIPYERLSEYTPSNGQVLTYDSGEGALVWSEVSGGISEVNWGDIGGSIDNQTDLKNKFDNISSNIQSLDTDMSTNYQNLDNKVDDAIQNLETDIQDAEGRLQTQIDTLSSIGQFLAIWDCDTGIARYLNEGFEYQTGNYFIIGTIAEGEGAVNYMPDGNMYPGKAEATEEDIKISDMWFYDGEHWIYLANHERAIAVDADLDVNSTNPIENKAVTKAVNDLDVKIDDTVDTINVSIEELKNRPIPIAVPQLASVDVDQVKTPAEKNSRLSKEEWMGDYSDIIVTLNLTKEQILERMYDLYVTVSRFKTNKNLTYTVDEVDINYRNISKFSVMNDLRQKTDKRLYCWRFISDSSYNETDPRRYVYMYTKELYTDGQALREADPDVGLWSNYESTSGIGTCFNAICWTHGYTADGVYNNMYDADTGIERYEEGDIDSFANVSNSSHYPEYNISNYVTKIECRKYTKDGQNYFFWAEKDEWENGGGGLCVGDYLAPIPNGIPKYMETLVSAFDEVRQLEENGFVFVEKRPDLNYRRVENFDALLEALQDLTFRGKYVDGEGRPVYWNCYWFDYPVMPVLLKDCMVRSHFTNGNWTGWETLENVIRNGWQDELRDDLPLELKLPYNTYYLWMRFCALQKRCAYGSYSNWLQEDGREIDIPMWPYQKHNLKEGVTDYSVLGRRAFARPRQGYKGDTNSKVSEYVLFNVCSPLDAASGSKSKSTPIQKKLNIDRHAKTGLRD